MMEDDGKQRSFSFLENELYLKLEIYVNISCVNAYFRKIVENHAKSAQLD